MTEKALGWVMIGSVRTRTNREQSQGSRSSRWPASAPMGKALGQSLAKPLAFLLLPARRQLKTVVTGRCRSARGRCHAYKQVGLPAEEEAY
jgi:hypothetical protein